MFFLRWLTSRSARQACEFGRHARKLVRAQRDLLKPEAAAAVLEATDALRAHLRAPNFRADLDAKLQAVEAAAGKHLRPYPHPSIRENIEVILVAVTVALAIRTYFLQPFKIPTGSMQPTLYGITVENLADRPDFAMPGWIARWLSSWGQGVRYIRVVAEADGSITAIEPPKKLFPFVSRQRFRIGATTQTIWFPPSTLPARPGVPPHQLLFAHAGARPDRAYRKGEPVIQLKVVSGDHLFVDRLTYNFRRPRRGEITVFETRGIIHEGMPQDQFYIKRLVGLGGETLELGADRHLRVNGERLDAGVPRFENVYSFDPDEPPRDSRYSGHVRLPDLPERYGVRPNHYFVMGDNTMNSFDSRMWGDFSRTNIIGKYCFVYWPFHARFGWAAR